MTQESFDFEVHDKKCCAKCGQSKSTSDFYKHPDNKDGMFSFCKTCHSHRENLKIRLRSGFSSLKPDHCECCGQTSVKLDLDHCHETEMFRGFICRSCNKTLGLNGDSYETIKDSELDSNYLDYMKQANHRMGKVYK